MFENSLAMAVLPASDLERARRFWSDVFGLTPVRTDEGGDFYVVAGVPLLVYETQFAGTAQNTSFGLFTDDLDRDMAALREKGVTFNEYDLPGLKTENGVVDMDGERGAWFNDSEGNIISIAQPTSLSLDDARAILSAQRA
jgi:catechol 2,3-dioxygenase-like lactoylglutathione lyase family enzyme